MNYQSIPNGFSLFFVERPVERLADIWSIIISHLRQHECCPSKFLLAQDAGLPQEAKSEEDLRLTPDEICDRINRIHRTGFSATTGFKTNSRELGVSVRSWDPPTAPAYLLVSQAQPEMGPPNWNNVIEQVMKGWRVFGAYLSNRIYEGWQTRNVLDDFYFRRHGQLPHGYRTIPDTHPSVLIGAFPSKTLLDISKNPGRVSMEGENPMRIAAEMWLGPNFWKTSVCSKNEILASGIFIEKHDTPHYLYLKSWPHPFTRPDGEQGRVQQKLWQLLYHQDCEWPPGSGGISDVPVGGPLELMP